MQLTDKIFKGLYRRGVMLEQMKEPALSRTVKQLLPVEPCENPRDCEGLSAEEILLAAQQADIVDETDGRPLAEKLREVMGSGAALLIDAIDDEPYVSSQMGPMLALRDQCAAGIRLAARVLGTADTAICSAQKQCAQYAYCISQMNGCCVSTRQRNLDLQEGEYHI